MSRNTDPAVTSASQLSQQRARMLVSIESLSAAYNVCNGDRFIYAMATTFSPVGHLGGISSIKEDGDPFPRAVNMWISIVDSVAMYAALNENLFRKRVTGWDVLLTDSGTCVGTPQIAFKGRINTGVIRRNDPERGNFFEVEIETRLKQTPAGAYMSRDSLARLISSSGDTFFDHLHLIPHYSGTWGTKDLADVYRIMSVSRLFRGR